MIDIPFFGFILSFYFSLLANNFPAKWLIFLVSLKIPIEETRYFLIASIHWQEIKRGGILDEEVASNFLPNISDDLAKDDASGQSHV